MEKDLKTDEEYPNVHPPRFTAAAVNRARPVVPLRSDLTGWLRQRWDMLGTDKRWGRLIAVVVAFALAGGVVGGLAAAFGGGKETIEPAAISVDAERANKVNATPDSKARIQQVESTPPPSEFDEEAMDRAAAELRKRRSPSQQSKVLIILQGNKDDDGDRNKRGRKHRRNKDNDGLR